MTNSHSRPTDDNEWDQKDIEKIILGSYLTYRQHVQPPSTYLAACNALRFIAVALETEIERVQYPLNEDGSIILTKGRFQNLRADEGRKIKAVFDATEQYCQKRDSVKTS
jgi:hypothetical protein